MDKTKIQGWRYKKLFWFAIMGTLFMATYVYWFNNSKSDPIQIVILSTGTLKMLENFNFSEEQYSSTPETTLTTSFFLSSIS